MRRPKVLFADTAHPSLTDLLESQGFECDHLEEGKGYPEALLMISNYQGLIIRSRFPVDQKLLEAAERLRFIGRVGAGMENVDVKTATKRGIACLNAPEGNRDAVAEQAIGMLLMLMNHLSRADREVRQGLWRREANRGHELGGKTVGIIGYGNTGNAFAQKLAGFGVNVLAYDKYKSGFGNQFVEEVQMPAIFARVDVLSLHVPLSQETRYLVDDAFLRQFAKPIWLINTSRGPVLKTAALLRALENGKVRGACLDVLEFEETSFESLKTGNWPEEFSQLVKREDVVLSPHIAGWTHESNVKMARILAEKIANLRLT